MTSPDRQTQQAMLDAVQAQPEPLRQHLQQTVQWMIRLQKEIDEVKDALVKRR